MKSKKLGSDTLGTEVTNVSPNGVWMLIDDREHFLSFDHFPWFRDATIAQITHVERPMSHHLYWPELDIDLHVESIADPEKYPLTSR
jgi:hypothetical protein